jgi:hypothetical protein
MSKLSDAEREERRHAALERARNAVEALKTSDGWKRWLRVRRYFHRYTVVI